VDAHSYQVLKRIDMGQKLEEAGYPDMSAAVRPMALSPDERFLYFQVSFFHGFAEYDLQQDRVLRLASLPVSDEAAQPREEYLLDSAHHGLSMNPEGTKLCAAGTMDDYAAIVRRDSFAYTIVPVVRSRTGRRTAVTGATASCPSAARTGCRSSRTRTSARSRGSRWGITRSGCAWARPARRSS
jgi:hypothetical protein